MSSEAQWVGSERKEERKRGKRSLLRGARIQARLGRWRLLKPKVSCPALWPYPCLCANAKAKAESNPDADATDQTITSGARR